jgi:hypothetical protein
MEQELDRFTALGLECTVDGPAGPGGRLVVRTSIRLADGNVTPVVVVYPDGYPDRRFAVYAPALRLAKHQSFGGNLCVFPRSSAYWRPGNLAADVVAFDVPNLIRLVADDGEELRGLEDPQAEPWSVYYPYLPTGAIVVDGRALALPPDAVGGTFVVAFDGRGAGWLTDVLRPDGVPVLDAPLGQAAVVSVLGADRQELLVGPSPLPGRYDGPTARGAWARLPAAPWATTPEEVWQAVSEAVPQGRLAPPDHAGLQLLGLVFPEQTTRDSSADAWVFAVQRHHGQRAPHRGGRKGPTSKRPVVVGPVLLRGVRWTDDDLALRIPELAGLRGKAVALFGLGSLGAPLAAELAKGRVGALRIADDDHLEPGTSVRHPLGLEYAGVSKPIAVASWLWTQYPGTHVVPELLHVGQAPLEPPDEPELAVLGRILNGAALVVTAMAEDEPNRQIDRLAREAGLARLHVWSVSGYGGVVALLRPGRTGCYHCLELLQADRALLGTPLVRVPDGDVPLVQGRGCGDRTFTAAHADLLPLVAQAARAAFGELAIDPGGYPRQPADVLSVQLRDPDDGTQVLPAWTGTPLPPDPRCPDCFH